MSTLALALVLIAALLHASWNLLNKLAGGGTAFLWLFSLVEIVLFAPVVALLVITSQPEINLQGILFLTGSAVLHIAYFWLLNQGYRVGDLSLVYPLARGSGPLLASVIAVALLGESPTGLAIAGMLFITLGGIGLAGDLRQLRAGGSSRAVALALLTGLSITSYTVWDKIAVSEVMLAPLLLTYATATGRVFALAPFGLRHRDDVKHLWRAHKWHAVGIAVMGNLAYILVLTALTFSPVSYIAPAREISVLAGTVMGVGLLNEGDSRRRIVAASLMVVGIVGLAVG